ncbi:hypothetical protein F53441_5697 [Fusarium austroafricanum]|uniref:Uncharacterized protein n=1 Tax=Fusarium austroafricanum TaxID=2364996 RepID=A0A8H4P0C4_9HYPO|nr:hypothetical protein F53441_5697 [Fusarium austroafricanum]
MFRFLRSFPIRGIIAHYERRPHIQLGFSPSRLYTDTSTNKPQLENPPPEKPTLVGRQADETQPEAKPEAKPEDAKAEIAEQEDAPRYNRHGQRVYQKKNNRDHQTAGFYVPKGILPNRVGNIQVREINRASKHLDKTYPDMPPNHKAEFVLSLCDPLLYDQRLGPKKIDHRVVSYVRERYLTGEHGEEEVQQKIDSIIAKWRGKDGSEKDIPVSESA